MQQIKVFFASLVSFMLLDFVWFSFIVKNFVREKLGPVAKLKPDGSLNFSLGYGVVAYALMAVAMAVFVWPKIKNGTTLEAVLYSGLAGLIIFGVYDFTNLSFAKYWPKSFAAEDIFWGVLTTSITGLIIKLLIK